MKALTVEEYAVLTMPLEQEYSPTESDVNAQLVESGMMREVSGPDRGWEYFGPTPHGDRAVRVHRAWLQSMGVKA